MEGCHSPDDAPLRFDFERVQISLDHVDGVAVLLDEDSQFRATADRLDANGTCAGVGIDEDRIFNQGREDIEECLAEPIRSGARFESWQRQQTARTEFTGNDTHDLYPTCTRP